MKRTLLITLCIFFLHSVTAFSQELGKRLLLRNQIGFQFNPYIDKGFFYFMNLDIISALRYGRKITKNVTTGIEFFYNFPINIKGQRIQYYHYQIGVFSRYSVLSDKRVQFFAEASPYYSYLTAKGINSPDFTYSRFGIYAAPGVSLYSKHKRISLDLYYKFSNLALTSGKHSVLSYKINFNF